MKKGIPKYKLVERQGLHYEVNSTTPFTGTTVDYHENGQLWITSNYKDGKEDGLYEELHKNGQLRTRGNYKNGERDGFFEDYYENGQLWSRGYYKDGKEQPGWLMFDRDGNPL